MYPHPGFGTGEHSRGEKTNKQRQLLRIVPGTGGGLNLFKGKRETHKK